MSKGIKRVVMMSFRREETENFIKIFRETHNLIRAFPGCRHVELLKNTSDSSIMYTLSLWDSEEHLNHYRQSELFKTTWAKTKVLFKENAQAWSLEEIDI